MLLGEKNMKRGKTIRGKCKRKGRKRNIKEGILA
jgi:hypothetical protein